MTKETQSYIEIQEKAEAAFKRTLNKIDQLGERSEKIYTALNDMQNVLDAIKGFPEEKRLQYRELESARNAWKKQAEEIMEDLKKTSQNTRPGLNWIEYGVSFATFAPNIFSGLATSYETLSLGFLAPSLGVLPTLGIASAIGISPIVSPVSVFVVGALWMYKGDEKKKAERLFAAIYNRDIKKYRKAITEINTRIKKIDEECYKLNQGVERIKKFGKKYSSMSETRKYELGAYINLMMSSTQLLINPIKGLQPAFSEKEFDEVIIKVDEDILSHKDAWIRSGGSNKAWMFSLANSDVEYEVMADIVNRKQYLINHKNEIIFFCNLLDGIDLLGSEGKIICKCLKRNSEFLKTYHFYSSDLNDKLLSNVIKIKNDAKSKKSRRKSCTS